jgi:hypothetical protein
MTADQGQPNAAGDDVNSIKLIIMMGFTTVAYAAIIYIAGVVMSFNIWARSFIMTTLRLGACISYVIKDLILVLVANFLIQFIWATATDLPQDIKRVTRCVRTRHMRIASRMLPCGQRNERRKRLHVDTCFMLQTTQSYDGKKYPECAPYHGARQNLGGIQPRLRGGHVYARCGRRLPRRHTLRIRLRWRSMG